MVALTSHRNSAIELIAVMTCVSMVSILWQILKSRRRDEQNTARRKFLSAVYGILQLAGFVVAIVVGDVSVSLTHYAAMRPTLVF
jgi:thiol:disulfide interchange protein